MPLTKALIDRSDQCVNVARMRELTLRGNHIEVIENLGASRDQFETIDLSDNNINKIPVLPPLDRLKVLVIANNNLQRIAPEAFQYLPNLESAVLSKNKLRFLVDLKAFAKCRKLRRLTLRGNDVCRHEHYRAFVIYTLRDTELQVLDCRRVTLTERKKALVLFEGIGADKALSEQFGGDADGEPPLKKARKDAEPTEAEITASQTEGRELLAAICIQHAEEKQRVEGTAAGVVDRKKEEKKKALTDEQKATYRRLIENAATTEDINRLERMFGAGDPPPEDDGSGNGAAPME